MPDNRRGGALGCSNLQHQYFTTTAHKRPVQAGNAERPRYGRIVEAVSKDSLVPKADLIEKAYLAPIRRRQFRVEEGIVYYFEYSKATRVRQLLLRGVPPWVVTVSCGCLPPFPICRAPRRNYYLLPYHHEVLVARCHALRT
jgi:hypothetical protein